MNVRHRLARSLHRLACRLRPIPPLLLIGEAADPWEAVDILRSTLTLHGVSTSITIVPRIKQPPPPDAVANVASIRPATTYAPAKKKSSSNRRRAK